MIYIQSSIMPLSGKGVEEVTAAASQLRIQIDVMDASDLYEWLDQHYAGAASGTSSLASPRDSIAAGLIAAGGTLHFPSLVVYRDRRIVGKAILGYKKAAAYRHIVAQRLSDGSGENLASVAADAARSGLLTHLVNAGDGSRRWRDFGIPGPVGPYFRWVPGTTSVAFEMKEKIYLLDLVTGERVQAPGFVDFIPSPDGRLFVTPARNEAGLEFYDARAVRRAAIGSPRSRTRSATSARPLHAGEGASVRPFFVDKLRRDQYPSVGLLVADVTERADVITYRVLTSWFDRAAFRDYRVTIPFEVGEEILVRTETPVIPICQGRQVSIPIISKDGRELGGRDESTGTTKVFKLEDDGRCSERLDLGIPTGKVAFDADGRRIAFAVPPGMLDESPQLHGIFVLDRVLLLISKVPGSAETSRLAFPEFVADKSIIFLLASEDAGLSSRFRVVSES